MRCEAHGLNKKHISNCRLLKILPTILSVIYKCNVKDWGKGTHQPARLGRVFAFPQNRKCCNEQLQVDTYQTA